jgi:hypothetical protein
MALDKKYPYQIFDLQDLPNEVWVDVKQFEGKYKISNLGRVKSLVRTRILVEKIRKQVYRNRYLQINLPIDSTGKFHIPKKVHKLVAQHFVINPHPRKYKVINHKNSDRFDNSAVNLEHCTQAMNVAHSNEKNGLYNSGEKNKSSKLTDQDAKNILKEYKPKKGLIGIARKYKVHKSTILGIINNTAWKHIKR